MPLENDLEAETLKQLEKLEKEVSLIAPVKEKKVREELENLNAYISDTRHFLKQGDLVKAFEAIVFAWGIYETLLSLNLISKTR
ncbi:MAG: DUF357 domain-containing protein [Candidatus Aenigmarchaeota archaeon]|nr:DUF357 domain-containing protein [Candidatus Aenigmarchaeota archaeon]